MNHQIFQRRPFVGLAVIYLAWKSFLLAIALGAAVGPSYDTSTSLFFERLYGNGTKILEPSLRLTRWDAIYFMHATSNGKIYEQEWAFGWGLSVAVGAIRDSLEAIGISDASVLEPLIAIVVAHITHLLAVLVFYQLSIVLFGNQKLAFVSGVLHILSPAGLFLSAPYAESPFAFFTMLGNLLFACAIKSQNSIARSGMITTAGFVFGVSCLLRSNGVASGLLFAVQAIYSFLGFIKKPNISGILDLGSVIMGGMLVASGTIAPQIVAWNRYCSPSLASEALRPWCSSTVPSIFTYVQEKYW